MKLSEAQEQFFQELVFTNSPQLAAEQVLLSPQLQVSRFFEEPAVTSTLHCAGDGLW